MSKERFSLVVHASPDGLTFSVGIGETEKVKDIEIISEQVVGLQAFERELDYLIEQIEEVRSRALRFGGKQSLQ